VTPINAVRLRLFARVSARAHGRWRGHVPKPCSPPHCVPWDRLLHRGAFSLRRANRRYRLASRSGRAVLTRARGKRARLQPYFSPEAPDVVSPVLLIGGDAAHRSMYPAPRATRRCIPVLLTGGDAAHRSMYPAPRVTRCCIPRTSHRRGCGAPLDVPRTESYPMLYPRTSRSFLRRRVLMFRPQVHASADVSEAHRRIRRDVVFPGLFWRPNVLLRAALSSSTSTSLWFWSGHLTLVTWACCSGHQALVPSVSSGG
jgi:hypothetical protein